MTVNDVQPEVKALEKSKQIEFLQTFVLTVTYSRKYSNMFAFCE